MIRNQRLLCREYSERRAKEKFSCRWEEQLALQIAKKRYIQNRSILTVTSIQLMTLHTYTLNCSKVEGGLLECEEQ